MYGYVYITTNNINGKVYIGQKKAEKFEKYYYGSGFLLKKAINKYSKENFSVDIITWCETKEDIDWYEKYYISVSQSQKHDYGYNITDGGEGSPGRIVSDETKRKMSISQKGKVGKKGHKHNNDTKELIRIKATGRKHTEETKEKMKISKSNLSDEVRKNMSEAHIGQIAWNTGKKLDEAGRKKLSDAHKGISNNWEGKKHKEETKKKISEANKGNIPPNKGVKLTNEETRKKLSDAAKNRWNKKNNNNVS